MTIATRRTKLQSSLILVVLAGGMLSADAVTAADYFYPYAALRGPRTGYYHAATAQESILNGRANVIAAAGEAARNRSVANIHNQQARSLAIDNNYKAVANYFSKRELNRKARFGSREDTPYEGTPASVTAASQAAAASRLDSRQLDPQNGAIGWPTALLDREFDAERVVLNRYFAARAYYVTDQTYKPSDVIAATNRMLSTLRTRVREMNPQEYVATKIMIKALAEEAQSPAAPATFASN